MKKTMLLIGAALLFATSCKDDELVTPPPTDTNNLVELSGELETQTLTADKKYLIKGQVFVRDGKVLTIQPGTVVFGDKRTRGVLVIDKGGKLEAVGTADKPIVFTSNQEAGIRDRGDWGGIVMLGRANTNQPDPAIEGITPAVTFGTLNSSANNTESSGTLKYVRVEFAGIELTPNNETNSITMGALGSGTTMEYVMVSFGGDDGFEWFGGTINGKYLISHATWDDDFDVDFGYSGNVQFALANRYPGFADQSQSNGFECDNGPNDNDVEPYTTGTFSNVTVIGPILNGSSVSNANFAHAIDLRRRTAVTIANSVFTGFPIGIRMNQPSVLEQYSVKQNDALVNNILVARSSASYAAGSGVVADSVRNYWTANNTTIGVSAYSDSLNTALGFNSSIFFPKGALATGYATSPDFTVSSGTLTSGASFTHPKFDESNRSAFFNKSVQHIGAFGSTNWAAGWAEFNPVDKAY